MQPGSEFYAGGDINARWNRTLVSHLDSDKDRLNGGGRILGTVIS